MSQDGGGVFCYLDLLSVWVYGSVMSDDFDQQVKNSSQGQNLPNDVNTLAPTVTTAHGTQEVQAQQVYNPVITKSHKYYPLIGVGVVVLLLIALLVWRRVVSGRA